MTHESRLFGAFSCDPSEVLTFPEGLLGFAEHTRYVLKKTATTKPLNWLLSVEDGGPELALLDPSILVPSYNLEDLRLETRLLSDLQTDSLEDLSLYAIVSVPRNIHQMSMNLRTPIVINPKQRIGMQYPAPGICKQPVRRSIYRDLLRSRPEDKPSVVVTLRKLNEAVEIGDEISVQILEFADGGVRLGITAPRRTHISRSKFPATPLYENLRANDEMNLNELKGVMSAFNVVAEPQSAIAAHHTTTVMETAV